MITYDRILKLSLFFAQLTKNKIQEKKKKLLDSKWRRFHDAQLQIIAQT